MVGINSKYFISLFCHGITREQATPGIEMSTVKAVVRPVLVIKTLLLDFPTDAGHPLL